MQFGILGPLQVVDGGRRIDLGAHRQRAVLAILVLHADDMVSLDRLIDLLWGHTPPNAATGSLQAYVSNLRRVLEPDRRPRQRAEILVTEAPGYRLRVDRESVDAFRFERLVDQARGHLVGGDAPIAIELLDEALSSWRGEALAEFRYENFAAVEVARLDELRVAAEEDRAEALLNSGNHGAAVQSLNRLAPEHPLRERLRALQMLALYRSGRQTEALRVYDDTRRTLADELGLSPGPQLQELVAQVLEQSPALFDQTRAHGVRPAGRPPLPPRGIVPDSGTSVDEAAMRLHGRSFVGRSREVRALEASIRKAAAGQARFVLVGGEAGIGKTRLVEHVAAGAAGTDLRWAWGRCHDDDGFPPLWPWVQVIQTLQGDGAGGPTDQARSLTDLLDVEDDGERPNPELARFRLYESVQTLLQHAAQASPIVIVLDDLQWADPASLRLLRYLAVELRSARVLVVGTFHEPDPTIDSPLAGALADLARRSNVDRLSIAGLALADVTELVRLDTPVDNEAVEAVAAELHRRTDGNAFFLNELVRLLESEDSLQRPDDAVDIPLVVRDVVHRRLGRLPDDAQAVLLVAAVVGREFSLDVLHRAAGLSADEMFENLEAAVIARVVIETGPGRYRFSHGLVRETLYSDLTPGRRARLHANVGRAMESVYDRTVEAHASRLAHHFHAAGEAVPAARYSELAAEQSERSLAYDDAISHWESAIRTRDQGGSDDAASERARLLLRLAAAHRGAGDAATSAVVQDRALEAAEVSGDDALLAEAALAYGEVGLWQVRPYGTVDERVADAISRLLAGPIDPDGPLRARLLTGLAVALYYRESERERGRGLARQAVSVGRRVGDPQLLAAALVELIVMLEGQPQAEQAAAAHELEALLDADLSFEVESTARMRLARVRLSRGDATSLEGEIDDVWRRAEEQRQPIVRLFITWARATEAFLRGRLADAEELASSAFELHHELGIWGGPETYALHMALIWREQDRLGEVAPLVEPLLEQSQHPGAYKLRALFALERGASSEIEAILGPDPVPRSRDFTWLVETCLTAELCAAARLACSEELYELLLPLAGQVATMDGTYVCLGATSHYLGLLADALGRRDHAIAHLEDALVVNEQIGAVPWSARTRFHLARLLAEGSGA